MQKHLRKSSSLFRRRETLNTDERVSLSCWKKKPMSDTTLTKWSMRSNSYYNQFWDQNIETHSNIRFLYAGIVWNMSFLSLSLPKEIELHLDPPLSPDCIIWKDTNSIVPWSMTCILIHNKKTLKYFILS